MESIKSDAILKHILWDYVNIHQEENKEWEK